MRLSKAEAKYLRSLQQKKIRDREKKFVIEGWRALGEALHAAAAIEYVALAPGDLAEGWAELVQDLQRLGVPVKETDDATLDRMLDENLMSTFHILRAVIPHMRNRGVGRILAIGSRAAVEPSPGAGAYAASKAALVSLIRTIAVENKDRCISANVVLPGTMDTPKNRKAMPQADYSKWVQPAQVASLLVALAADSVSQISGAVIPVYGAEL